MTPTLISGSTVPSIPDLRKLGRKRSVTGLNFHASMNFKRSAVGSEDNVFVAEATSDDVTEKRSMEEKLAALDKPTSYDVSKRAEKGDKSDEATYSDLTSFCKSLFTYCCIFNRKTLLLFI